MEKTTRWHHPWRLCFHFFYTFFVTIPYKKELILWVDWPALEKSWYLNERALSTTSDASNRQFEAFINHAQKLIQSTALPTSILRPIVTYCVTSITWIVLIFARPRPYVGYHINRYINLVSGTRVMGYTQRGHGPRGQIFRANWYSRWLSSDRLRPIERY